jgi:hypothetical protein
MGTPSYMALVHGIRDRDYRGEAALTYRLHIGDLPVVSGVYPLGDSGCWTSA